MAIQVVSWPARIFGFISLGLSAFLSLSFALGVEGVSIMFRVIFTMLAAFLSYASARCFQIKAVVSYGRIEYTGFLRSVEFRDVHVEIAEVTGAVFTGVSLRPTTQNGARFLYGIAMYKPWSKPIHQALHVYQNGGSEAH